MVNRIALVLFSLLSSVGMSAQSALDETMHSSGKINVVIAVIGVILLGFFIYLFMIDRKVTKLEKQIELKK
jgi:hypothetical protein